MNIHAFRPQGLFMYLWRDPSLSKNIHVLLLIHPVHIQGTNFMNFLLARFYICITNGTKLDSTTALIQSKTNFKIIVCLQMNLLSPNTFDWEDFHLK